MSVTVDNHEIVRVAHAVPLPARGRDSVRTGRGRFLAHRTIALVLATCAVVLLGAANDSTLRYGLVIGGIYAIALLGSNAITGLIGEINLSTGAFMAIGAYVVVYLLERGLSTELALMTGVLLTTAAGLVLAIPTVRLEGIFTALVTFALAFAVPDLIVQFSDVTGGQGGKPVPMGGTLLGVPVSGSDTPWLVLILSVYAVLGVLSLLLLHGRVGRVLLSVGESGAAAECFGLHTRWRKIGVWTFAAAHAGLAGGLFALTIGFLTPEVFPVFLSVTLLIGTVVGGPRSPLGALAGGLFVGTLPPQIQTFVPAESSGMFFGAALFVMLLAGGRGFGGLAEVLVLKVGSLQARFRQSDRTDLKEESA
jgi:branched-chain amino acid transport system permease protein